jgi:hypothetical protein
VGQRLVLEAAFLVRAVTEGLIGGMAAAAQLDGCTASEAVLVALHVINLKVSFDEQRAVIARRNFRSHFFSG